MARKWDATDQVAFTDLLVAWNLHEDMRRDGAPIDQLGASRIRLEEARSTMWATRHLVAA
jgi:hypothetical protein